MQHTTKQKVNFYWIIFYGVGVGRDKEIWGWAVPSHNERLFHSVIPRELKLYPASVYGFRK